MYSEYVISTFDSGVFKFAWYFENITFVWLPLEAEKIRQKPIFYIPCVVKLWILRISSEYLGKFSS